MRAIIVTLGQPHDRNIRVLRWASPLLFLLAVATGLWAFSIGNYGIAAVNAFLAGCNAILSWVHFAFYIKGE